MKKALRNVLYNSCYLFHLEWLEDGKILKMVERHEIEGHSPMQVIEKLQGYFDQYCEEV